MATYTRDKFVILFHFSLLVFPSLHLHFSSMCLSSPEFHILQPSQFSSFVYTPRPNSQGVARHNHQPQRHIKFSSDRVHDSLETSAWLNSMQSKSRYSALSQSVGVWECKSVEASDQTPLEHHRSALRRCAGLV